MAALLIVAWVEATSAIGLTQGVHLLLALSDRDGLCEQIADLLLLRRGRQLLLSKRLLLLRVQDSVPLELVFVLNIFDSGLIH